MFYLGSTLEERVMCDNPIQCPDDQDDFDRRLFKVCNPNHERDQIAKYSHNDFTDFDRGEYDCLKGYPHQMYESEEYDNGYAQQYASEQKNPNLDPE
jgi:hypothetical protein|tara:strand:+ start:75 stop:365 length:291 start_codon:yes stop_codon:yes gene_type:complete